MSQTTKQVALITGASRGIGAAIARRFAKDGWRVAVHYHRSPSLAAALCEEIEKTGGEAFAVGADITNADQVRSMTDQVLNRFGTVDVLVNNAGIALWDTMDRATEDDFDRLVGVNQKGMFLTCRALYHHMVQRGQGAIVNVSSIWGQSGASCEVLYSMTKAAVIGFTRALAAELGPSGVRVNAIAPGVIDTDMLHAFDSAARRELAEHTPLGRLGQPEDVADAVLFLAQHPFITGQILGVDGGFLLG